jgi:hypothetical protein
VMTLRSEQEYRRSRRRSGGDGTGAQPPPPFRPLSGRYSAFAAWPTRPLRAMPPSPSCRPAACSPSAAASPLLRTR